MTSLIDIKRKLFLRVRRLFHKIMLKKDILGILFFTVQPLVVAWFFNFSFDRGLYAGFLYIACVLFGFCGFSVLYK